MSNHWYSINFFHRFTRKPTTRHSCWNNTYYFHYYLDDFDFINGFWEYAIANNDPFDWTHFNALAYDENENMSENEVHELMEDYYGVTTYHVVADPNNEYIDHID